MIGDSFGTWSTFGSWMALLAAAHTHKHTHPHTCFVSLWHGWECLVLNWETVSCGAWSMLRHHHKVVHLWRWRVTYRNIIQKVSNKSCTKLQKSISWCFFMFLCFFQRQWSRIIKFIYVQHTDTDTESHINIQIQYIKTYTASFHEQVALASKTCDSLRVDAAKDHLTEDEGN